jgi:hypothetical protein
MAQNGLILARGVDNAAPDVTYVVDPQTGSQRSVPEGVRAINASGVLAGLRPVANCNDFEAYLLFPDGSTRSLGSPLPTQPAGSWCLPPAHWISELDDQLRLSVTWGDAAGAHGYLWDGATWRLQAPPRSFISAFVGDHAVGWSSDEALFWRAGVATDLGAGRAWALNPDDLVAGEQDNVATVWSNSIATQLPLPPGCQTSSARAVSDSGVVGGSMLAALGAMEHGFLWSGGSVQDFNDFLDSHELLVTEVGFIGRNGIIAGRAVDMKGNAQAFAAIRTSAPFTPDPSWREKGQILAREPARDLAIDRSAVYWIGPVSLQAPSPAAPAHTPIAPAGGWTLRRVDKTGGAVRTLAAGSEPENFDGSIVTGGGYVYFRIWEGYTAPSIRRIRASGGTVETVSTGFADFAADDENLYTRAVSDGTLLRMPHSGGTPMVLEVVPGTGVATDGSELWYGVIEASGGTIRGRPRDGGAAKDLFPPVSWFSVFESIKVDSSHVYFEVSARMFHGFYRVPRTGGTPERLPFDDVVRGFDPSLEQLFRARPFLADGGNPGCLIRSAADGSAAACVDSGPFRYQSPRADADAVYVIRDLDIVRIAR